MESSHFQWISKVKPMRPYSFFASGQFHQFPYWAVRYYIPKTMPLPNWIHSYEVKTDLELRFGECGLELHSEKTKIVYFKEEGRKREYHVMKFNFLGYTFRPRLTRTRQRKATRWVRQIVERQPNMFVHWGVLYKKKGWTIGGVWIERFTYGSERAWRGGSFVLLTWER